MVFKRYEYKYLLTIEQKEKILKSMEPYMKLDAYGKTTIRNLYFDTDTYLLIRRSLEKPIYKEKLRLRSYAQTDSDSQIFVELKKKYKKVVYKRRISMSEEEAMLWFRHNITPDKKSQILNEIEYFLQYYKKLHPTMFISYEREAYYGNDNTDFRITFDDNILCRQTDLSLRCGIYGTPILPDGIVLMEIKCSGGIPLWLTSILSNEHLYKTSFSKYGTAYRTMIFPQKENNKGAVSCLLRQRLN